MYKTIILLTLILCLLTIVRASQRHNNQRNHIQRQNCASSSQCYSEYAGLYYLTLATANYTWRMVLTLRLDSSTTWTGSDQKGVEQLQSTDSFFQPYSDANGKWVCDKTGIVQIKDYGFMYEIAKSPNSNMIYNTNLNLKLNNPKQIKGTLQYRTYNLNTTHLDETARTNDNKYLHLYRDQIGEVVDNQVTVYQIDRFC